MARKKNPHNLSEKEWAFVQAYCGPYKFNGTQSVIHAGYAENSAHVTASQLLRKTKVSMAIKDVLKQRAFEYDELTRQIIAEYSKIAFADYTKLASFDGFIAKFNSTDEIPDDLKACIKKVKTTDSGVEVELYSKEKALADLAKITGMFVETKRVVGDDYETLIEKLTKG